MRQKIAFISEHASPLVSLGSTDSGGQNVYVGELTRQLLKLGFDIDIFTRWEDAATAPVVKVEPGLRVIHVKAGPVKRIPKEDIMHFMSEFGENMLEFIVTEEITYRLVHANFWMSGMVAMHLKQVFDIPFVITFHALGQVRKIHQKDQDKFPQERIQIEEEIVRCADRVIAECPQDMEDLENYYHADPDRIVLIPCGFNPREFFPLKKSLCKKHLGLEDDEQVVLQLGRVVPRKGIDNVINAFSQLSMPDRKLRLIIVGGEDAGPGSPENAEMLRLKTMAKKLNVADRVVFAGRKDRKELKYYYGAADLFITTPWYEPFGITPLEAMACGTPVIGADVGGIKYTVSDGRTGLLVPPNEPVMLKDRIQLLLENESLREYMGLQAQQHVLERFTWQKVAMKVSALYQRVFEQNAVGKKPEQAEPQKVPKNMLTESLVLNIIPMVKHTRKYGS